MVTSLISKVYIKKNWRDGKIPAENLNKIQKNDWELHVSLIIHAAPITFSIYFKPLQK